MRSFLRFLLEKPILWLVERYTSSPDHKRVFSSLTELKETIETDPGRKGFAIPFDSSKHRFVIFSDQHKGRKNGADDFASAEPNYLAALDHYEKQGCHLIALGDCEELWENTMLQVIKHNEPSFSKERAFVKRKAFTKIVGNHDLDWEIDPIAPTLLKRIFGESVPVFQGVILETTFEGRTLKLLCTHGHQGDAQSDGNWFSKFFVTKIWAPLQAYLRIYPNTPAYDQGMKTEHNRVMLEWANAQQGLILITGHTHQPVFCSLTHFERLELKRMQALREQNQEWAEAIENEMMWRKSEHSGLRPDYLSMKPVYFNTGCCCFSDGDITGIEIADNCIRLIKWTSGKRMVLEETSLASLASEIQ